jgi:NitT/TauT family transport system substrate-binding protein
MRKFFVFLLTSFFLAGCANPVSPTLVKLPMGYIPNIQFAPFYVAMEKGYFKEAGIDLEFDYAYETDGIALVGAGKVPFSLASGEQVLLARAQGLPITTIYSWYKGYPITLITTDPTIKTPADLKGKTIGLPGLYGANYVGLRALLSVAGLTESDVTLDSIGYSQIESIVSGKEQNVVCYSNNEPIVLAEQGITFSTLDVSDYLNLASNGIVTNEAMIKEHPEVVKAFLTAFSKGIQETIKDPEAAYEMSKNYVEGLNEADKQIQMKILQTSIASWNSDMMGASDQASWQNMQKVLMDMQLYSEEQDLGKAFTNDFIQK